MIETNMKKLGSQTKTSSKNIKIKDLIYLEKL